MSGPLDAFLSRCVSDCVNANTQPWPTDLPCDCGTLDCPECSAQSEAAPEPEPAPAEREKCPRCEGSGIGYGGVCPGCDGDGECHEEPLPCDPGCEECEAPAQDCCDDCGSPDCEGHPDQEPDSLRSLGLSEGDFL